MNYPADVAKLRGFFYALRMVVFRRILLAMPGEIGTMLDYQYF